MKRIIWFVIILATFVGCGEKEKKSSVDLPSETLSISDNQDVSVVETISYVPLKESKDYLFTSIDKMIVAGEHIFILDKLGSNSILCFSMKGDFITKIGNTGQGPGEYIRLSDFDVKDELVYLYDRNQKKMIKYDLEGNFVDEKKTSFRAGAFKLLPDNSFLFSLAKESETSPLLIKTNEDFEDVEVLMNYSKSYIDDKGTNNIFQSFESGFLFNKAVNDSVYILDKKGNLKSVYVFDFGNKSVPADLKNSYEKLAVEKRNKDYAYLAESPLFMSNKYFIAESSYGKGKATLIYDLENNKSKISQWLPKKIKLEDIILPITSFDDVVVGSMDINVYENLETKPNLSEDLMEHLNKDGKILIFYHIKK